MSALFYACANNSSNVNCSFQYSVTLTDLVDRFETSPARIEILQGFLSYRMALHKAGFTEGFQWINGSFLENVELLEGRDPRDIDVVTFLRTPDDLDFTEETYSLFDHGEAKKAYKVDAYFVELDAITPRELTFWSAYWYSLWSHRRNSLWKGYVQVELAPANEAELFKRIDVDLMRKGLPYAIDASRTKTELRSGKDDGRETL